MEAWGARLVQGWDEWIELPVAVGDRLAAAGERRPVAGAGPRRLLALWSAKDRRYSASSEYAVFGTWASITFSSARIFGLRSQT